MLIVAAGQDNTVVCRRSGETAATRIPIDKFLIAHLVSGNTTTTTHGGYVVVENRHKGMPRIFISLTDQPDHVFPPPVVDCNAVQCDAPLPTVRVQHLHIGKWYSAATNAGGEVQKLEHESLPKDIKESDMKAEVTVQQQIQERANLILREEESNLEIYTRRRVLLAFHCLRLHQLKTMCVQKNDHC